MRSTERHSGRCTGDVLVHQAFPLPAEVMILRGRGREPRRRKPLRLEHPVQRHGASTWSSTAKGTHHHLDQLGDDSATFPRRRAAGKGQRGLVQIAQTDDPVVLDAHAASTLVLVTGLLLAFAGGLEPLVRSPARRTTRVSFGRPTPPIPCLAVSTVTVKRSASPYCDSEWPA